MIYSIDINCDLGETPGHQENDQDNALLDLVSSANIACGFHAGDAQRMEATVRAAAQRGVAIGAHPGLDDKANFGRIPRAISPRETYQLLLYQIGALYGFTRAAGATMHHVKLHGALYHMVAQDGDLSLAVIQAIQDFDSNLRLYALAGSKTIPLAKEKGIAVIQEGFADRRYHADGSLVSRTDPRALITKAAEAVSQATSMVKKRQVWCVEDKWIPIEVDTLCIHGDGAHALAFAQQLVQTLHKENINISAKK